MHVQQPGVVAAAQVLGQLHRPHAGAGVESGGHASAGRCLVVGMDAHRGRTRRRRPQAETRAPGRRIGAGHRRIGRGGVDVVQRAWQLGGGGLQHAAACVLAHQQQRLAEQLAQAIVMQRQAHGGAGSDMAKALLRGSVLPCDRLQHDMAIGPAHALAGHGLHAGHAVVEAIAAIAWRTWPAQGVAVQPDRACFPRAGRIGGQDHGVARVAVGELEDGRVCGCSGQQHAGGGHAQGMERGARAAPMELPSHRSSRSRRAPAAGGARGPALFHGCSAQRTRRAMNTYARLCVPRSPRLPCPDAPPPADRTATIPGGGNA